MVSFCTAAFPWVAFSIGLAVFLTYMNSKTKLKKMENKNF